MKLDECETTTGNNISEDGISWRINFALDRKYKTQIPVQTERYARTTWVAEKYGTYRPTADGWLYYNRKPRKRLLEKIAIDTGVDKHWLVHGGNNPYARIPYQDPKEIDNYVKMKIYLLLNNIAERHGLNYQFAGEMLEVAVTAIVAHHSTNHNDDDKPDEDLALAFGRLLNEVSFLNKTLEEFNQG